MGQKGYIGLDPSRSDPMATLALKLDPIDALPRTPASDVKKLGWRGVMKAVGRRGRMVVTNHNQPEAVILSAEEYAAIMRALAEANASGDQALDALRARFDQRLASLQAADAGERLRTVLAAPAVLGGEVKAEVGR